jgi:hypothetical protein
MKLKVISVSANMNSFGLVQMVLVGDNGQGWKALANAINAKPKDTIINVSGDVGNALSKCGFECPQRLHPDVPDDVMQKIWGDNRTVAKHVITCLLGKTRLYLNDNNTATDDHKRAKVFDNLTHAIREARLQRSDKGWAEVFRWEALPMINDNLSFDDGEVVGIDHDGNVIMWNGGTKQLYNCGQTPEQIGTDNLGVIEMFRCGL